MKNRLFLCLALLCLVDYALAGNWANVNSTKTFETPSVYSFDYSQVYLSPVYAHPYVRTPMESDGVIRSRQELLLSSATVFPGDSSPVYTEVKVLLDSKVAIENFLSLGLDLDHFHPEPGENTVLLPREELNILQENNIGYKILVDDVASAIEKRNTDYLAQNPISAEEKTTAGFELGSMGGFYTYAEVLAQLDEMKTLYPSLITDKFSIGTTGEGRTIWAVKISDNPDTDESAAEAPVYFDALHHAREPASMATVINFMFHLLEGYAGNTQINYLVDNREIFFVPVVNPDGYEYNRQTNPNGGGLWRKNRRVNSGSSCRGVDLNRNYDTDFGGTGTSNNPCSNSYRGTGPFSEPESQAVRDFTTAIGSSIAYTTHTSGGYWLGPDFSNNQPEFAIHAELNSDCMDENEYIYGDANLILGYVAGTTQGWMYEEMGTLTWTPEIGTTGFWPTVPEIIPLVNQQIKPYEYACWVAGARADYQNMTITSSQGLTSTAPLDLDVRIKNTGLSRSANNVNVTVSADNAGVTVVNGTRAYGNIASRAFATNASPFTFTVSPSVPAGTVVTFTVSVSQDGVVSDSDSFKLTVGQPTVLFTDNAESGSGAWSNGGSGTSWQSSDEDSYSGASCFVDSRLGHTATNNSRTFTTTNGIPLAGTTNPRLEFAAKWGLHTTTDYVRLQASANGGAWVSLTTSSTETINGGPAFKENEPWTFQSIDLSAYVGQSVRFRFLSVSNGSLPSDGFYFDDFNVIDYGVAPSCDDGVQNGSETGVDCGGPDCAACETCSDGVQNGSETGVDCGGPDCAACETCSDGIQNGSETGVDCGGPDCAACETCNDGVQNGSETGVDCGGPDCAACPAVGLNFDQGVINNVNDGWVSVPLSNSYGQMVVVASVVMPNSGALPVATRIRNASGNTFELRVQTTTGAAAGNYDVHYVVVEAGVYTVGQDGVKMEAVRINTSVTAENNNWAIESRSYQQSYSSPVVLGQVMSFNDADWSTFWASSATSRTNPPSATSFGAGKNVGEDPDNTRATEEIGYIVIEAGNGTIGQTEYTAGLGADNVFGVGNTSTGYPYTLSGLTGASSAVVSAAAMDGNNGGWPVLYGGTPFTPTQLRLAFDEDQANDTERAHTSEQIAYWAFGADAGAGDCFDGIQNGSETGVDCGGPDCNPCNSCSDGIQNGSETGIDCGGPDCAACETCDDGIQNGSETGIDCGGPDCTPCETCDDGIQNGNETGIDCGGPECAACETCDDGIQNGNETGIDCGGPDCAACESCDDGIQNGSETGIDCGGPDCVACPVNYCASSANSTQFEHIASITIAGVTNATGNDNGYGDYTGATPIPMGGTVSFSMTPGFPGSAYTEGWVVWIDYNADGDFNDAGERTLQVAGSSTVTGSVTVPAGLSGTSRMRIQMRYNAFNGSSCGAYSEGEVEDYTVDFSGATKASIQKRAVVSEPASFPFGAVRLFPNPVNTELTIVVPGLARGTGHVWRIVDAAGKESVSGKTTAAEFARGHRLSVDMLPAGMYYFSIPTADRGITKRFIVSKRQ